MAVPSGQTFRPAEFPLAGLLRLLTTAPSWANDRVKAPVPSRGGPVGGPHQVADEATRANGGSGRAPGKVPGALPEQERFGKADEPEAKTPVKSGYIEGQSAWLEAESSETTSRYRNPDGTISNHVYQTAVNFRSADGKLRPIDTALSPAGNGRWQTTGSPVRVSLVGFRAAQWGGGAAASHDAQAETEVRNTSAELAGITFPGGQELGYRLQGARIGAATKNNSAITYRDVLPSTDVELIATKSGIKETLILKSHGNTNSWVFPLRLVGLTATVDVDGSIALVGADGKPVAAIPRGNMQDAMMQGDGEFTTSNDVTYELVSVDGGQALKVTADKAWLDDPARVYPVRIDPSAALWDDLGDVYVDATSVQNVNSLGVGCYDPDGAGSQPCNRRRAFLSFANFGSYAYGPPANSLYGMRITGANLKIFHTWSEDCPSTREVHAYKVTQAWSRTSMPNGRYPGAAVGEQIGKVYIYNNSPACTNSAGNRNVGTWWNIPITNLNIFNEWSLDYTKNHGIALTSENDDDRKGWKRFTSRDYDPANGANAPYIDFTWEYNTPPQIERQYPSWGYSSPTLNPELIVTAKDPDGWPRALTHLFQIWPLGGAAPVATSPESNSTSFRVPDGALKWGQTYQWRVQSNDGRNWTDGDWNILTTPVPQPPITSSLAQNGGHGFTPTTGNYTTSVVDGPISSVGPPLAITRSYNSRDPRVTNAFGAGWSSILDSQAAESAGQVTITYPTGQNVAFGRNTDGTFHSPQGKYSTFKAVTNPAGYEQTDKEGTRYLFTAALGGGIYGLTSITDIQNRKLELLYENGRPRWIVSHASNRTLHLTWTTTGTPRVAGVATDPVVAGDWNTANYWRYTYVGNKLEKACQPEPADDSSCTVYQYGSNTLQPTAVLDARPHTYLKLDDPAGAVTAASAVQTRDTAIGVATAVTFGQTGRPGSPTVASFNGTNSSIEIPGKKLPLGAAFQTVSVWFKTTAPGVIYSYQEASIDVDAPGWNPALYVDIDGKLRGKFWNGNVTGSVSTGRVDDNAWHHAALVASGASQTLYVDGVALPSIAGTITPNGLTHAYLGTGQWVQWDRVPAGSTRGYFNGQISDFAWFDRPLTDSQIKLISSSGKVESTPLTKIVRPGGGTQAEITYTSAGTVKEVKDANLGTWQVSQPAMAVNDQSYANAVLAAAPQDYFRMKESGVTQPINEVNGGTGTYSAVTLGVDGGPFGSDVDVASFDGTASHVVLPTADYPNGVNKASSVSLWFRTTGSGVLYSAQSVPLSGLAGVGWHPVLYVDVVGKLRGGYWSEGQSVSAKPVNDGVWHHAALASSGAADSLYLDGMLVGTRPAATPEVLTAVNAYAGAGQWLGWPGTSGDRGYFKGQIGDFAYFAREIGARDVAEQFAARDLDRSAGSAPYRAATVATNPTDYYRLAETSGAQATNQVGGAPAANYANPKFGMDGPFTTATSAVTFNGSSSYVELPARDMVGASGASVSVWFNAPKDRYGPLYSYQVGAPTYLDSGGYVPAIYVGVDGKLRGKFWDAQGWANQMASAAVVNDGEWHHAVLAAHGSGQSLYLDGMKIGSVSGTIQGFGATHASIGAGKWKDWPQSTGWVGWFAGQIGEFSFHPGELSQTQVTSMFAARDKAISVPSKVVKVTDPMGGITSHVYDVNDGRQLEQIDAAGARTSFGYDSGGFLYSVTDPNGNVTIDEHDTRGNTVARITCQDRSANICSTVFSTYHPDDGTPRSNKVTSVRDGRSANIADDRYKTSYTYDAAGNQTEVVDPLGRVTRTQYTSGQVIQADLKGLAGTGRYVRMKGSLRGFPAGFSLFDVEVYGPAGKDLARGKPATSSSDEAVWSPPWMAVDGDPTTRWSSGYTDSEWLVIDLGSVQAIDRVKLNWETAYGKNYAIEVSSDTTTWTSLRTVTNQAVDYIPAGLPWRTTTPGGLTETVSYLLNGDVDYTVDEAGLTTRFVSDPLGRPISKREVSDTYPDGLVTTYEYDRKSRLRKQTDPGVLDRIVGTKTHTLVTTAVYNFDDQVTSTTMSDLTGGDPARTSTVHYNSKGQKDWDLDPEGNRTEYTYDLLGRMVTQKQPDNTVVTMEYDANGLPVATKIGAQTMQARSYDKGGRLAVKTDAMGWQTHYTYTDNNLSATVTRVHPDTLARFVLESNKYDAAGNLIERKTNNDSTVTTYAIDNAARNTSQTLDPGGLNRTVSYVFGADNQLISVKNSDSPATSQVVDYTYDTAGRQISEAVSTAGGNGMMGRWKLDGNGKDAFGNSPGVAANVTFSAERGGAGVFDPAAASQVAMAGPVVNTAQSYTVAAWVNLTEKPGWRTAVSIDGNRMSNLWLGYDRDVDRWRFSVCREDKDNTNCPLVTSTTLAPLNTWTHLAGTYDTATGKITLFVNGQEQGFQTIGASWEATGNLMIGRGKFQGGLGDHWKGSIDDVQAYQRSLSATEIAAIYNGTAPVVGKADRTSWQLDQRGLVKSETDGNGNRTDFVHDEAGQLAIQVSPTASVEVHEVVGGQVTVGAAVEIPRIDTIAYNVFGEAVESKNARGDHSYVERDLTGAITSQWLQPYTPPGASTAIEPVSYTEYDAMGRAAATVDPLGNRTAYEYDAFGQLKKVTAPDTGITEYTYDLNGQVLSVTDATGAVTTAEYDHLGRRTKVTQGPNQTAYGYHAEGWLASVTPIGRASTTFTYNKAGERTKMTDGKGNQTVVVYDFAGRQKTATAPSMTYDEFTYDHAGRVTRQDKKKGTATLSTVSASFDSNGNALSLTDAMGTTSTFTYDRTNLLTQMSQPVSAGAAPESIVTSFGYDQVGNPTRFTNGMGRQFLTTYNRWGLPEHQIEPGNAIFTTVYNEAGLPVRQLAPGGVSTTATYDVMGRLKQMSGTGAEAATVDRVFDYDKAGRTTKMSGPGGTNTLAYDNRGLLESVTGPSGNSSYGYTADGLLSSRVDAAGTTTYNYDEIGRLSQTSNSGAGLQLNYAYDNMSRVSKITYGGTGNERDFVYDDLHLRSDTLTTSADALVSKIEYEWDLNSNLKRKVATGFAGGSDNHYDYDLANRLTSWNNGSTTTQYKYDRAGNRTKAGSRDFAYDDRNQLTSSSDGTSYQYTPRGTLASTTVGTVSKATQSDAFNQVIRQYSSATAYSEYSYDGLGRVIKPGFSYTGLGNDLAADPTGSYIRDAGNDLVGVKAGGPGVYALTDLHTDVVGQFGATSTALTASTTYDPFGKVVAGTGMLGSLGYQSEWTDTTTGRVNMHARWYNPDTGQFDSRDAASVSPVPNSGSANRFAYAAGNPMTRVDPSGNDWMSNCKSVGGCIVQGFVNSFDAISAVKKIWNALSNVEQTVRNMANSMKQEANKWKGKIRGMLPGGICGIPFIGGAICDGVAFIGGWACALSGVCEIVDDCIGGNTLKCAEHVGEALAEVVMGILSGGAAAVGKFMLKKLISKFDLPGKNNGNNNNSNNGNDGSSGNNNSSDSDMDAEKKMMRDSKKNNSSSNNKSSNSNSGSKSSNSGGNKSSGSKSSNSKSSSGSGGSKNNTPAERPAPPADQRAEVRDNSGPAPGCDGSAEVEVHSFDPATPVLMSDGTVKPIKDIEVGEKVTASDPATGETSSQPVTKLHVNLDRELTDVVLVPAPSGRAGDTSTGEGRGTRSTRGPTSTLQTTQNHPYWDATTNAWVEAKDLVAGTSSLIGPDGQIQRVVEVRNFAGAKQMRDLTVATVHTYYVLSGAAPVLVHNNGKGGKGEACPRPGHIGEVTIFDSNGKKRDEDSTYFSGRQILEETLQGKRKGAMASHTEARATREAGSPYPYWHKGDDPVLGRRPATAGDTYYIEGELEPCSWCRIAMEEAAINTETKWVYTWMEEGVQQFWWTGP